MTFVPPPYPYDRLAEIEKIAAGLPGGSVDLSIGTPCDPPPEFVVAALSGSHAERGYPASVGAVSLRESVSGYLGRRFGVDVAPGDTSVCVGTKEFVASLAQYLHLRDPDRDTILHPAVAYPTYEMSARLAGLRSVGVAELPGGGLDLSSVDRADAERALALWVNSPSNPSGLLTDLSAAAEWGRSQGVTVVSDECYAEFTWSGGPETILSAGSEGVIAVHSLSKRSNLAGCRVGFFAGDSSLVKYVSEVRRHAGLMVPGPVQHAARVALDDDEHVERQRGVYLRRLRDLSEVLAAGGITAPLPSGTFYLWVPVPGWAESSWAFARALAEACGMVVSPGDLYGEAGAGHVRIAVVQPDDRLALVADRLAGSGHRFLGSDR